jgi:hypothetical protein
MGRPFCDFLGVLSEGYKVKVWRRKEPVVRGHLRELKILIFFSSFNFNLTERKKGLGISEISILQKAASIKKL